MSLSTAELNERKTQLSPLQYQVTQEKQTERPFSNKYNKHWEAGSYNCVLCDTELFRSETKFESKSGWPAFSNVVDVKRIKLSADLSHVGANLLRLVAQPDLARTSVECANCNAHLGHLFHDGPKPTGLRYCINSSSLNFVPSDSKATDDQPDGKVTTATSCTTKPVNSSQVKEEEKLRAKLENKTNVVQRSSCPNRAGCGDFNNSSKSAKICFFQSPVSTTPATAASSNSATAALSKTASTVPNRLIVNSSSSGSLNLGSRNTWKSSNEGNGNNNNNNNNTSMVRRRISLFSASHMPTEMVSVAPKMIILRETSL